MLSQTNSSVFHNISAHWSNFRFILCRRSKTLTIFQVYTLHLIWTKLWNQHVNICTAKRVFKTTWEIGTTWELTAAPVPRPIQYIELDLRNKTTSEFRTVFSVSWVSLILRYAVYSLKVEPYIATAYYFYSPPSKMRQVLYFCIVACVHNFCITLRRILRVSCAGISVHWLCINNETSIDIGIMS